MLGSASAAEFLSTPSVRRATSVCSSALVLYMISIHALREEGDTGITMLRETHFYFYPRPP